MPPASLHRHVQQISSITRSANLVLRASRHLGLSTVSPRTVKAPRCISCSAAAGARARKKATESFELDDLPLRKLDEDGTALPALAAFSDAKPKRRSPAKGKKKKESDAGAELIEPSIELEQVSEPQGPLSTYDAEYRAAVDRGEIPETPLAKEVFIYWKRFPDSILLIRVGKFYESYFTPAITLSNTLSLKLAYKRYTNGLHPFSGFPVHQLDKYLKILAEDLGHTVVVVEEYDAEGRREALVPVKKHASNGIDLKDRRVGRVVTPGTLVDETWASGGESRYLLALALGEEMGEQTAVAMAYTDASTGEFFLKESTLEYFEDELARIAPREVVLDRTLRAGHLPGSASGNASLGDLFELLRVTGVHVSYADPFVAPVVEGLETASKHAQPTTLDGLAISLLRHHLQFALRDCTPELTAPDRHSARDTMLIDAATLSALEIRHAIRPGGLVGSGELGQASPLSSRGTLLSVMASTMTAGGHRLLVRTLSAPSTDITSINARLDLVEALVQDEELREELRDGLKVLGDVMRIVQRFKGRRGEAREAWEVGVWVRTVQRLMASVQARVGVGVTEAEGALARFVGSIMPLTDLADIIEGALDEAALVRGLTEDGELEDAEETSDGEDLIPSSPPSAGAVRKLETRKERAARVKAEEEAARWWMRPDFDAQLAQAHQVMEDMRQQQTALEQDLRKKLKIPSIHLVKARNMYLVLSSTKLDFAALDKSRRLVPVSETRQGKSYAYDRWTALGSRADELVEQALIAQRRAFDRLRVLIVDRAEDIRHNAEMMDELDMCLAFAQTADERGYVRPVLDASTDLDIIDGRHPSVESSLLDASRSFMPNSTIMTPSAHLHIITGPNQGGKSTLLRQTAVIAILAQAGSFVPAREARLGVVDKVFSRIGARDDLFRDRSTFMLEMVETAAILRHATERSLVIMDEIGRGTTLHSGLAIAHATLDHILSHIRCRTLFATHYHEVADMLTSDGNVREGIEFWCTDVDEVEGAFSYQYQLRPGLNRKSHAIKAAKLAGMPQSFLTMAETTLRRLDAGVGPSECARQEGP